MPNPASITIVNVGNLSTHYRVVSAGTSRLLVDIGWPGTTGKMRAIFRREDVPTEQQSGANPGVLPSLTSLW